MINLLISDFDGTLADTFQANYLAYRDALAPYGITLSEADYQNYFGLRFDDFMTCLRITDPRQRAAIRNAKSEAYPKYFDRLRVNQPLLDLIRHHHAHGGLTAIASTARRRNLLSALAHIGATADFDIILAGEDADHPKPHPEIYQKILSHFGITPDSASREVLVFEDSPAGLAAAQSASLPTLKITLR
ncbi:MAG: HAD family phosphatase [Muribaculaceae bacterium]|nr:HAD family phosphatase [Muribaculaceae bacterium]